MANPSQRKVCPEKVKGERVCSKRCATTSDITEGDLILIHQNLENKLSLTFDHIDMDHIELWRRMEMQLS